MSVLKRGAKGDEVRQLQEQLNGLGYGLTADGDFGAGTEAAVKNLQTTFGYDVDGVVGDGTRFLIKQQTGYGWTKGQPRT